MPTSSRRQTASRNMSTVSVKPPRGSVVNEPNRPARKSLPDRRVSSKKVSSGEGGAGPSGGPGKRASVAVGSVVSSAPHRYGHGAADGGIADHQRADDRSQGGIAGKLEPPQSISVDDSSAPAVTAGGEGATGTGQGPGAAPNSSGDSDGRGAGGNGRAGRGTRRKSFTFQGFRFGEDFFTAPRAQHRGPQTTAQLAHIDRQRLPRRNYRHTAVIEVSSDSPATTDSEADREQAGRETAMVRTLLQDLRTFCKDGKEDDIDALTIRHMLADVERGARKRREAARKLHKEKQEKRQTRGNLGDRLAQRKFYFTHIWGCPHKSSQLGTLDDSEYPCGGPRHGAVPGGLYGSAVGANDNPTPYPFLHADTIRKQQEEALRCPCCGPVLCAKRKRKLRASTQPGVPAENPNTAPLESATAASSGPQSALSKASPMQQPSSRAGGGRDSIASTLMAETANANTNAAGTTNEGGDGENPDRLSHEREPNRFQTLNHCQWVSRSLWQEKLVDFILGSRAVRKSAWEVNEDAFRAFDAHQENLKAGMKDRLGGVDREKPEGGEKRKSDKGSRSMKRAAAVAASAEMSRREKEAVLQLFREHTSSTEDEGGTNGWTAIVRFVEELKNRMPNDILRRAIDSTVGLFVRLSVRPLVCRSVGL
eukprot:Cvel_17669.t1-p1 / transcript=Cvel_17669.t1 / gene=Cvel_17669 / organism=Chromera_velia_CCMP2878 / gene_product=hypothetical protein / transcript_product=hypothetical protein / location=Cvel_scaffold1424:14149-16944(-) / protein_length=650 / sequence_SO=supercontig / SO=protein_coding / is_pseudo=false